MYLDSLYLKNFRLYKEKNLSFAPHLNVIIGPNGSGKTTILEAIHLLMTGRSFRTSQIKELIQKETDSFYAETNFIKYHVEQSLKFFYKVNERRITYNQTPLQSSSGLLGLLQGAILTPNDVNLIKGQPTFRRQFLDMQLSQADPLYVHHLSRYYRAMAQRNHLLRAKITHSIETWEKEMVKSGVYLVETRSQAISELSQIGDSFYTQLSTKAENFNLDYRTFLNKKMEAEKAEFYYQEQLQKHRSREMALGNSLIGPHRDDFIICLQNKEARYFASEGQQRSCAVALRLAEWERLKRRGESIPIMLLDDVGFGLDLSRRKHLLSIVQSLHQVFISTTEELPFNLPSDSTFIQQV
jgi:DNA replication and repair protein RecF